MEWGYLRYDIGDSPLKFAVRSGKNFLESSLFLCYTIINGINEEI